MAEMSFRTRAATTTTAPDSCTTTTATETTILTTSTTVFFVFFVNILTSLSVKASTVNTAATTHLFPWP